MNKYALDPDLHYELKQAIEGLTYLTNAMAFRSVGSTNDYALLLEKDHLLGGTIIMAAEQTSGRGRLGRTWHMQKGDIAMSLLLRAPNLPRNQALLPMMPALSIVRSLGALAIPVRLKWPNDVIVPKVSEAPVNYFGSFRKVGGVLVENVFRDGEMSASVIGIGLNVVKNPALQKQIPHAASLGDLSPGVDRGRVLKNLLPALNQIIGACRLKENENAILREYENHCETLGSLVSFASPEQTITGRATRLNADGSLTIHDGVTDHIVYAGDINLVQKRWSE